MYISSGTGTNIHTTLIHVSAAIFYWQEDSFGFIWNLRLGTILKIGFHLPATVFKKYQHNFYK